MKRWTYNQITHAAEARINNHMRQARLAARDEFLKGLYEGWAYGVYDMWRALTLGCHDAGDDERLRLLTEAGRPPEGPPDA